MSGLLSCDFMDMVPNSGLPYFVSSDLNLYYALCKKDKVIEKKNSFSIWLKNSKFHIEIKI